MSHKVTLLDGPWIPVQDVEDLIGQSHGFVLWLLATQQVKSQYHRETNTLMVDKGSLEEWAGHPIRKEPR